MDFQLNAFTIRLVSIYVYMFFVFFAVHIVIVNCFPFFLHLFLHMSLLEFVFCPFSVFFEYYKCMFFLAKSHSLMLSHFSDDLFPFWNKFMTKSAIPIQCVWRRCAPPHISQNRMFSFLLFTIEITFYSFVSIFCESLENMWQNFYLIQGVEMKIKNGVKYCVTSIVLWHF